MPTKQRELATQFNQITDALLIALVYWLAHAVREELAFRYAEHFSIIAPFRYTSLLWAILFGWLLFAIGQEMSRKRSQAL